MQKPPQTFYIPLERRRFLKSLALISAGFTVPGYLAEALTLTPSVTQGPFYPLATNMPLDDDNDLAFFNPNVTAADGIVTYVYGRVLDTSGNPIKNALVELWHTDNDGNYIYSNSQPRNPAADPKFQGFGQFLTASSGGYLFRTARLAFIPAGPVTTTWALQFQASCTATRLSSSGTKSRSAPMASLGRPKTATTWSYRESQTRCSALR